MTPHRPHGRRRASPNALSNPAPTEPSAGADCPHCSEPLSLSQPDMDSPERLLGICELCERWFFLDLTTQQAARLLPLDLGTFGLVSH
jgi:hypothetical protein